MTVRVCQVAPILYASMAEMLDRFRAKKRRRGVIPVRPANLSVGADPTACTNGFIKATDNIPFGGR